MFLADAWRGVAGSCNKLLMRRRCVHRIASETFHTVNPQDSAWERLMKRTIPVLMLITLLASASVIPSAWADGHADSGWGHSDDHGGRGGHWNFGWHDGHLGWLWVVGGALLIYNVTRPAPVPQPPRVIVQTTPYATPPAAPATAYWYFCPSSGSYYPYVQTCPDGWETVPATPPPSY